VVSFRFPNQNTLSYLVQTICASCPAYSILDFITRTIVCEKYRSFSFLLWPTVPYSLCFLCHSASVTWQHYFVCRFCKFFHTLWTVLCSRSLVAQLVTFMTFVQETRFKESLRFSKFLLPLHVIASTPQYSTVQYSTIQYSTVQ